MQSDYDAVTTGLEQKNRPQKALQDEIQSVLAWFSSHQKIFVSVLFSVFFLCSLLEASGSLRHLSIRSLVILSAFCSFLLVFGYVNFGKKTVENRPRIQRFTSVTSAPFPTCRTDFTILPWSTLLECGLKKLSERYAGRLELNFENNRSVWVNMQAFYSILEMLIERILTKSHVSIRIRTANHSASLSYQCLSLEILGAEEAECLIETIFCPSEPRLPPEQYFLYARQFMLEAGGKLLYKSDMRKVSTILFLFPLVD